MVEIRHCKFDVWITHEDLTSIRESLRGAPRCGIEPKEYFGTHVGGAYANWEIFVDTDWSQWDVAEYAHDLHRRNLIQHAIEPLREAPCFWETKSCRQASRAMLVCAGSGFAAQGEPLGCRCNSRGGERPCRRSCVSCPGLPEPWRASG